MLQEMNHLSEFVGIDLIKGVKFYSGPIFIVVPPLPQFNKYI